MADELPGNLTGKYLVRVGRWAFQEAHKCFHGPETGQNCAGMHSSFDSGRAAAEAIPEGNYWTLIGRGLRHFPEIELVNYESMTR